MSTTRPEITVVFGEFRVTFHAYATPEVSYAGPDGASQELYVPDHALLYVACLALHTEGPAWRTLVKPRLAAKRVSITSEDQEVAAASSFLEELAAWDTAYGAMTRARNVQEGR